MAANSFSESNEIVDNTHMPYMEPTEEKHNVESLLPVPDEDLGPLPPNWEKAFTESGEPYFIDHVAGTSSWLDPRLARVQKRSAEDCTEDELPFGWERIDDPQYGTYYIDHVNRKTQYENPVVMAKRQGDEPQPQVEQIPTVNPPAVNPPAVNPPMDEIHNGFYTSDQKLDYSHLMKTPMENGYQYQQQQQPKKSYSRTRSFFTRNPAELKGDFLQTTLIKSSRGLGFTIVGGDDNEEEFLQIKSVVPNGPAWIDGKLCTGDVLVYVHDICVLGYTHADVVNMFQNIEPNCAVYLEVCRGYPLTFDHNDPNTEIVTTVAVTSADSRARVMFEDYDGRQSRNNSSESMNTAKSMPDLSNTERVSQVPRPGSADLLSTENYEKPDGADAYPATLPKPEYLTIPIVKGGMGFGFTIADSAHGQKVKKILDRSRCKNLSEGDILVDINNINVKGMSHTEVVQVLKECPQGLEAIVMVQRGGLSSTSVGQQSTRKDQISPKKIPPSTGLYRSKTPTADMYSSQPKEVLPKRPKTPIIDTRSRSKTPNSYLESQNNHSIDTRMDPGNELQNRYHPPEASSYSRDFPYSNQNPNEFSHYDNKVNNVANQLSHASINGNRYDNSYDKYANYPVENQMAGYNYPPRDPYNRNVYPQTPNWFEYDRDNRQNNNSYKKQQYNGNLVNNSLPESTNYNSQNLEQYSGYGYHPYAKDSNETPRQDSGYSSQTQIPPSKNPYPPYYGQNSSVGYVAPSRGNSYEQNDHISRKREYTSFEMEHPSSGSGPVLPFPSPVNQYQNAPPSMYNFTVHLRRKESGFGFRIVGGTEEGSQVSIGHIVPGGAADQDGSVMNADEIIGVDGENVVGSSHHRVVQLMSAAAANGQVALILKRHSNKPTDIHNHSMDIQYPYDIMVTRRESEGFGFVIISSVAKSGSTIGRIIEGSPAERCGKLHVGDRILRVNGVDIKALHHGNIVNLIKASGYQVILTIGPPRDDTSSTASNSHRDESDAGEEGDLYRVYLERGNRGFGFSIRGGREFHNMPLFVLRIADNGPAAEDAKLKVGDQLVEVNGVSTRDMTHAEAIELIKQCGNSISLLVRRGGKITQFDFLTPSGLCSPVGPPPPGTHIRSTATLPSGSPSQTMGSAFQPSTSSLQPQYSYGAFTYQNHNGGLRPPAQSASYVPQLMGEQVNGPLGQSSPRVGPPMDVNWNRPRIPEH